MTQNKSSSQNDTNNATKIAIVIRGLPGSGKSSIAAMLSCMGGKSIVNGVETLYNITHSTDSYFYDEDGNYNFDGRKLKIYHPMNLAAFTKSCEDGIELVICDNTNTKRWEYEEYIKAALGHGYQVHIITVGDFDVETTYQRCTHRVPKKSIQRMKDRWEL